MPDTNESQPPELLFDHLTRLDDFTLEGEDAISEFLSDPTAENGSYVMSSFERLAGSIKTTLEHIASAPELTYDEKASMIASILIRDDERRNKFLVNMCKPEDDNYFHTGYKDIDTEKARIAEVITFAEEDECEDSLVDIIMQPHLYFMNADIRRFVSSDAVVEKVYKKERREALKKQAIQLGSITVASAIGSGIAVWLIK